MKTDKTPEQYFNQANFAISQEQWDRAAALAMTGLLCLQLLVTSEPL